MPLNLPQDFKRYEKTITNYCHDRIETYFGHNVYKALKARIQLIDDIIDLKFKAKANFVAEVAVPVVRKRYKEIRAFTTKYMEADPITTVIPIGSTPDENASRLQTCLSMNYVSTHYRDRCLHWTIDNAARYGIAVTYSEYRENFGYSGQETVYSPDGVSPYPRRQVQEVTRRNAVNFPIHPLNYFQDPTANYARPSTWRGFIDTWTVSDLIARRNDPSYIPENLEKVIQDVRKGSKDAHWYGGAGEAERMDFSRGIVNVRRMWATLPFEGNEDDPRVYRVELVGNTVIRCHENDYDLNIIPISINTFYRRPSVWWGNTDLEEVIPQQNLQNWLIATNIESTMKLLDRFILVRRGGGIDWADINNRHALGGVVPYEGIDDPSKMIYPVQFRDTSLQNLDWLQREIKQQIQESSPVVNLQNKYNQGGLNNSTLGAAQMVAGIGDILQGDSMTTFAYGIQDLGRYNAIMLQQYLGDWILIRPEQSSQAIEIPKKDILGANAFKYESAMTTSDITEFTKRTNAITQLLNWAGTGVPAMQGIRWPELLKDWFRANAGTYRNPDLYYDSMAAQPQQPPMPGAPQGQQPPPAAQMPTGTSETINQMGMVQ